MLPDVTRDLLAASRRDDNTKTRKQCDNNSKDTEAVPHRQLTYSWRRPYFAGIAESFAEVFLLHGAYHEISD